MRERGGAGKKRESPWQLKTGTQVAGFTVEALLASGSFGTVYRAKRDGRLFAIKLVPLEPRGEREVDALRRVRHPNVVGFHGYGLWPDEEPRCLVLALQLVEGRTLDEWAQEENPTALELVSQVLLPLADTLAAVHAEGVVHRDVKEANVVMRETDGQPVLVDFGAAGYEGAPRLTMRLPPGTPEYRSPEALRFAREWEGGPYPASPGDDLWALGVTTYWLLTRALPFGDRYNLRLVQAILQDPPIPPHELNPRVPLELSALCLRMLEKAPEARFADAGKLAEALEELEAQADDSWLVPLFPGERKEKRPRSAPRTEAHEHPRSRWWPWAVGLVLATAPLMRDAPPVDTAPRTELTLHHATPQASFGEEFDSEDMTAEVGSSAEPSKSPTPAPIAPAMHSEEHPVSIKYLLKSRKARILAAATCLAGTACASGPKPIPPPPPEDCPPGSVETMKRLDILPPGYSSNAEIATFDVEQRTDVQVTLRPGPVSSKLLHRFGALPKFSELFGQLFITRDRAYARFTQARFPNGELVPICMAIEEGGSGDQGLKLVPGSTPDRPIVYNFFFARATQRFE